MGDFQEQLAILRRRIAKVQPKGAPPSLPPPLPEPFIKPERYVVEQYLSGQEVQTPFGAHFETERLWETHRRHGSLDISSLCDLPHDLLDAMSEGSLPHTPCAKWAFLDTETTGLAGGSGTYAFLIGVGRITPEGFHLRQFFMRDLDEEASLLHGLTEYLSQFDTLITYNGKAYDQPLLETRFRMARQKPPFARLGHLDLLFGARRLWKLRFDSCRLVELENQILGVERTGDLPGEMIPYVYFEYLKTREAWRVAPILHHNAIDILTLACLTAIVPWAFRSPVEAPLAHGAEMVGLARWLRQADRHADALQLFRRGMEKGLREELLFRTLWDIALLEKKLGRQDAAIAAFSELATCANLHRLAALEELAKYYEHREGNYAMALEFTLTALRHQDSDSLHKRRVRLERRVAVKRKGRSLPLTASS
ncbi:MAG TPA: ribonuclease H-like domain-containing protein [Bryobacteraceae bacterium]|nr:ribonuclease H-like domain-containing protein [Bryobacteraceae bacterium]